MVGVNVLAMVAACSVEPPSVLLKESNQFPNLHAVAAGGVYDAPSPSLLSRGIIAWDPSGWQVHRLLVGRDVSIPARE